MVKKGALWPLRARAARGAFGARPVAAGRGVRAPALRRRHAAAPAARRPRAQVPRRRGPHAPRLPPRPPPARRAAPARQGGAIENAAAISKVTVVPAFVGHGIGSYFHGPPDIYHFAHGFPGMMEEGMTFTIEPVVAQGTEEVVILEDGWTAVMLDDGRAAQAEHTVLITENGFEILTQ